MDNCFGSYPVSLDSLKFVPIGLWALEFDNDSETRMYVDDTMLNFFGLSSRPSPEEMYRIWPDFVDAPSVDLINNAVQKMVAGMKAEVQFNWCVNNGKSILARLGGSRNPEYSAGSRIEGYFLDLSGIKSATVDQAQQRERLENDYKTIKGLANEFDVLHLLDLETDEFTPFFIENENFVDDEFLLGSFEGYYSAMKASIRSTAHRDYLQKMLNFADKEYLRDILRNKKRHIERFLRKTVSGTYEWFDLVLIKLDEQSGEAKKIAIGMINVGEEK